MKTITEMADEYAVPGRASGTEAIRKRAYLAGARAMQLEAYGIAYNGNGSDAADCAVNIANQIRNLIPE